MKIRNKILQFLAFVAVLCTSYSCSEDFFTEQAGNRITPENHYLSQRDLNANLLGAYIPLQTALPKLLLVDGLRSDLMDITPKSDGYMKEIINQDFSTSNPYIDGSDYYKTIINVNEILIHFDKVWEKDPITIEYYPKLYKGALISIRSWCYFTLVRLYGKAAFINDNVTTVESSQTFLNKQDMIDTLINQLKPYVFTSSTFTEYSFLSPNTKSLLGELYLENAYLYGKQYYDSAAVYLKLGLESYGNKALFKVTGEYSKERWKLIFYDDFNTDDYFGKGFEILDGVHFDSHKDQYNNFTGWTVPTNYMVKPSQLLVDSFKLQVQSKKDKVGDIYRGKGFTFDTLPGSNDTYYISKYNLNKSDPYSTYISTSRAADIHLLLAEALNQLGDTATALLLMNSGVKNAASPPDGYTSKWSGNVGVRGRVALKAKRIPDDVDINDPVEVKNAIEELILNERALELAFEGKRWFDLVRVAERRNDPNYLANKVAAKFSDPDQAASIRSKLQDKANWYLPVK